MPTCTVTRQGRPVTLQLNSPPLEHGQAIKANISHEICTPRRPAGHRIPEELLRIIFNYTQDFELCTTLHVGHDIPMTAPWVEQSTLLDRAILSASLTRVKHEYFVKKNRTFTTWSCRAMLRFAYVYLLDFFLKEEPAALLRICSYLLPTVASAWGRVSVLDWAIKRDLEGRRQFPFDQAGIREAMDEASRHGHVDVLEWWRTKSGCELQYSEDALSSATFTRQIDVLGQSLLLSFCNNPHRTYRMVETLWSTAEGSLCARLCFNGRIDSLSRLVVR